MFEVFETGIGLDVILWFQSARTPLFDSLAIFLSGMGRDLLYLVILAFVYWSWDKTLGIRALLLLLLTTIIVSTLKLIFITPRPSMVSDLVVPLVEETTYGVPSGHSAISLTVWLYLAIKVNKRWLIGLAIFYAFLQGISRMYLGVHYPQDVIIGWITGAVLLAVFLRLEESIYRLWANSSILRQFIFLTVASIITVLVIYADDAGLSALGVLWGGGIGLMLEDRWLDFSSDGAIRQRIIRYVVGLLILLGIFYGMKMLFGDIEPEQIFRLIRYAALGITSLFLWPLICVRTGLMTRNPEP